MEGACLSDLGICGVQGPSAWTQYRSEGGPEGSSKLWARPGVWMTSVGKAKLLDVTSVGKAKQNLKDLASCGQGKAKQTYTHAHIVA